ncbi:MAG: hypothetical protein HY763_00340 [Planctomycetes bacterium]|nr:hypothetical protein [Planctomycetota bacterium]
MVQTAARRAGGFPCAGPYDKEKTMGTGTFLGSTFLNTVLIGLILLLLASAF